MNRGTVLLLMSGANRSVSKKLIRLRGVLAVILGDVGGHLPLDALIALALSVAAMLVLSTGAARAARGEGQPRPKHPARDVVTKRLNKAIRHG